MLAATASEMTKPRLRGCKASQYRFTQVDGAKPHKGFSTFAQGPGQLFCSFALPPGQIFVSARYLFLHIFLNNYLLMRDDIE